MFILKIPYHFLPWYGKSSTKTTENEICTNYKKVYKLCKEKSPDFSELFKMFVLGRTK